jgi:hypothetical protein
VEELGVSLDEHIRFVIDALRPVQREIGLNEAAAAAGNSTAVASGDSVGAP